MWGSFRPLPTSLWPPSIGCPETKTVKNRLHVDVAVDEVGSATARIQGLGGGRLPCEDFHEYGYHWRVMADPEGNEFCLIYSPD